MPLTVTVTPANGSTGAALNVILTATASEALDPASVTASSFTLVEVGGGPVGGQIVVNGATATFEPLVGLSANTQYVATITGAVRSAAGTPLAASFVWSFTTVTTPSAPVIGTATAGDTQATVNFSAPASNGGAAITSYTATSNPGGITASGAASPIAFPPGSLINGTPYTFTVTATNVVGVGPPSAPSNSVTPQTAAAVPGAPTGVVATASDSQASVAFVAPGVTGSSAITSYTVTALIGGVPTAISASGGSSPILVTGLTNGTAYTFVVTALNSAGTGPASTPSLPVTPVGVPGAPTAATATASSGQATISFVAPVNTGGSPITSFTVTSTPSGITVAGATSPLTVLGLTNGTPYTFTVTATNAAILTGPASAPTNSATPTPAATAPGAPTAVVGTVGNAQVTVNFVAPAFDGGSPILGYTVTARIGGVPTGISASGGGTSIVVPGLTNGTAYTFTVQATNAVGTGPASAASGAATPAAVPGAPAAATATAGNAQATVSFTAPASDGGSAVIGYTVTSNPAGGVDSNADSPGLSHVITGLTNGVAYTFSVTARSAIGTGAPSAPTNSVTPTAATVPGAPTSATAVAGNTQATVTFTAPASNGGSAIVSYMATSSPGGFTGTVAGPAAAPITVSGLTNGTPYTFTVTATNAVGAGPASAASNAVVPATLPGAPLSVSAVGGVGQATVSFAPPASNGGAAISGYVVTSNPDNITALGGSSPIVIPGLTNGTNYAFTVTAINSVGTGPASAFSNNVTPNPATTVPTAPTGAAAVRAGSGQVSVTFVTPASDGGVPITGYVVTSNPPGGTDLNAGGLGLTHTVSGLTNGTPYTFTVTAINGVGTSPPSGASNSVTPATIPGAPTSVSAIAGDSQATVSFAAAPNNGDPVTLYTVFVCSPGCVAGPTSATVAPVVVTGLTNGTAYTFTVRATNGVGNGPQSAASNSVTPNPTVTVPGAPTGANATAGNAQATVTFVEPASDGGTPITGYTVTSNPPGGVDANAGTTGLSHTITGLNNGTAYTFTVRATNTVGEGPVSGASNTVTPATVPNAPAAPTAIAGNAQATVSFVAPANGGAPIISYTVRALIGGVDTGIFAGPFAASPILVTGLANGQPYTFDVLATNSVGTGPDSPDSTPAVTPSSATVPNAPTAVTATAGNGQATVNFTAGSDNGSAIVSYMATSSPGGFTGTVAGPAAAPITVSGLTNGTAYTFTVTATNGIGVSPASAASSGVTPAGVPGAPTGASATGGNGQATVSFVAPANGGSPITGFIVTSSPSNLTGTGATSPIPVTGLANGTTYTFTVRAINAIGPGDPSAPSNGVIPTDLATACSPTVPAPGGGAISLRAQASRVSGVAPLGVFFDASATTSTATTRPFHEIEYRWDFGEPASGVWAFGARAGVSSRNAALGPLASHLFDPAPGDYVAGTATRTVTLTASDGTDTATCSIQLSITDPQTHFAASTLCVAPPSSPTFVGCPAGATQVTNLSFDSAINTNNATSANRGANFKRILFKAGQTFTSGGAAIITSNGPGHVGVFPAGGARAIVTGATSKIAFGNSVNHDFRDWRVTDLEFDGVNRTPATTGIAGGGAAREITVWNSVFRNLALGFNMNLTTLDGINASSALAPIWNQWLIGNNQFVNNLEYGFIGALNRSALLGNLVSGQTNTHAFRLIHAQKVVVSNNDLTGTSSGTALTVRGIGYELATRQSGNQFTLPNNTHSEETVVSDNKLSNLSGGQTFSYTAALGTEGPRFRNHLTERNWIIGSFNQVMFTEASLATIRNNIFDMDVVPGPFRAIAVSRSALPANPDADNVFVYNNSAYTDSAVNSPFIIVDISGAVTPTLVIRNNFGYAPNNPSGTTASVRDLAGVPETQSNNSSTAEIRAPFPANPRPIVTYKPTQPSHWQPAGGSYLINGGFAVPVFSDFFAAPRTGNHLGAVNP